MAAEDRPSFVVRAAGPEDDALIAEHFRQMWLDNGIAEERICTHALLQASPSGRPVYDALGFQATNELRLDLSLSQQEC